MWWRHGAGGCCGQIYNCGHLIKGQPGYGTWEVCVARASIYNNSKPTHAYILHMCVNSFHVELDIWWKKSCKCCDVAKSRLQSCITFRDALDIHEIVPQPSMRTKLSCFPMPSCSTTLRIASSETSCSSSLNNLSRIVELRGFDVTLVMVSIVSMHSAEL